MEIHGLSFSIRYHPHQLGDCLICVFFQVPANRIGFKEYGGPFSLVELKVLQEVISLTVFMGFTLLVFRIESIRWNHVVGFRSLFHF